MFKKRRQKVESLSITRTFSPRNSSVHSAYDLASPSSASSVKKSVESIHGAIAGHTSQNSRRFHLVPPIEELGIALSHRRNEAEGYDIKSSEAELKIRFNKFKSPSLKAKTELTEALLAYKRAKPTLGPSVEKITGMMKVLQVVADNGGIIKDELSKIVNELESYLFTDMKTLDEYFKSKTYDDYIDTASDFASRVPYYYLHLIAVQLIGNLNYKISSREKEEDERTKGIENELKRLKIQAERFKALNSDLEAQLIRADAKAAVKKREMQETLRDNKLVKDKLITQQTDILKLKKLIKKQYETIDHLTLAIDASKKDRKQKTIQLKESLQVTEKQRLQIMEIEDNFKLSIESLKHEVEKVEALKGEISELLNTIHKLEIRAASNFEELTPRPNLVPLFEVLNEPPQKISTAEAVELIRDRMTELKGLTLGVRRRPRGTTISGRNSVIADNQSGSSSPYPNSVSCDFRC